MLVIRRKIDGKLVGTVTGGMTPDEEIVLNVIPNFGGTLEDYEDIEYRPPIQPDKPQLPTQEERLQSLEDAMITLTLGGM